MVRRRATTWSGPSLFSCAGTRHVQNTSWLVDGHPSRDVGYTCYGTYSRRQHGRVQAY